MMNPLPFHHHHQPPPIEPTYRSPDGSVTLYHGEALRILPTLPAESIDLLNADPPYSSGGLHKADRSRDPREKYLSDQVGTGYHGFDGDARDQRSWTRWSTLWLTEATRLLRVGGYAQIFTDWRQLPSTTDAVQGAGLVWRGIVPWDKGRSARAPHTGYHRHQCEFVAWATRGSCDKAPGRGPFPGLLAARINHREKLHPTAKPVEMLEQLMPVCRPGGTVLDPFMGSGSAGVAALKSGRRFVGIEQDPHHFSVALERLQQLHAERPSALACAA